MEFYDYNYLGHEVVECHDCNQSMQLEVLSSAAGYYVGRQCCCGPYSRESQYYRTFELADTFRRYLLENTDKERANLN